MIGHKAAKHLAVKREWAAVDVRRLCGQEGDRE